LRLLLLLVFYHHHYYYYYCYYKWSCLYAYTPHHKEIYVYRGQRPTGNAPHARSAVLSRFGLLTACAHWGGLVGPKVGLDVAAKTIILPSLESHARLQPLPRLPRLCNSLLLLRPMLFFFSWYAHQPTTDTIRTGKCQLSEALHVPVHLVFLPRG
jgi:hypothetical protein